MKLINQIKMFISQVATISLLAAILLLATCLSPIMVLALINEERQGNPEYEIDRFW